MLPLPNTKKRGNIPAENEAETQEQPFLSHLLELRDHVLRSVVVVLLVSLVYLPLAGSLFTLLAKPLLANLPLDGSLIIINPIAAFLTPLKFALVLALYTAAPYVFYQLWGFIAPGLYQHEQRLVMPLLISSTLLFYLGAVFAYFIVFRLLFGFLVGITPEGVMMMPDISSYLSFVLTIFFAFGLAFQVPVLTILLVWVGATTPQQLIAKRPYIIVGAFVLGAFLTPPDIISQTLLAIPMWLLFELGVLLARFYQPQEEAEVHSDYQAPTEAELEEELDRLDAMEDEPEINRKPSSL